VIDQPSARSAGRRVLIYCHNTRREEQHRWRLDQLLLMLEHQRPVLDGDPGRTFVVGGRRKYLQPARTTSSASILCGANRAIQGAMSFDTSPSRTFARFSRSSTRAAVVRAASPPTTAASNSTDRASPQRNRALIPLGGLRPGDQPHPRSKSSGMTFRHFHLAAVC
jgi:hypothetical protein